MPCLHRLSPTCDCARFEPIWLHMTVLPLWDARLQVAPAGTLAEAGAGKLDACVNQFARGPSLVPIGTWRQVVEQWTDAGWNIVCELVCHNRE